jgi:hypothetical protein
MRVNTTQSLAHYILPCPKCLILSSNFEATLVSLTPADHIDLPLNVHGVLQTVDHRCTQTLVEHSCFWLLELSHTNKPKTSFLLGLEPP